MVGALRVVSVERGHDPRDFTLAPFGGAGPLHGCALAALLGVTRVLIPPAPGVLCADGLLAADLKAEFSRTLPKAGQVAIDAVAPIFAELDSQADAWLSAEGVAELDRHKRRVALMRYRGQGGEIAVAWGETREAVEAAFVAAHQALYGFNLDSAIELVTIRIEATGRMPEPQPGRSRAAAARNRSYGTRCTSPAVWLTFRSTTAQAGCRRPLRRTGDHHPARRDHVRRARMERRGPSRGALLLTFSQA